MMIQIEERLNKAGEKKRAIFPLQRTFIITVTSLKRTCKYCTLRCLCLSAPTLGESGTVQTARTNTQRGTDDQHNENENRQMSGEMRGKCRGERYWVLIQPLVWWSNVFMGWKDTGGGQRIDLHLINDERKDTQTNSRRTDWEKDEQNSNI